MSSNRLKAVTIRIPDEEWARVVQLAREARRAPAELARLMLEDAIAARRADVGEMTHA
jgi:predicted transcriptional regulator